MARIGQSEVMIEAATDSLLKQAKAHKGEYPCYSEEALSRKRRREVSIEQICEMVGASIPQLPMDLERATEDAESRLDDTITALVWDMHEHGGVSAPTISETLNISIRTVYNRINKARQLILEDVENRGLLMRLMAEGYAYFKPHRGPKLEPEYEAAKVIIESWPGYQVWVLDRGHTIKVISEEAVWKVNKTQLKTWARTRKRPGSLEPELENS